MYSVNSLLVIWTYVIGFVVIAEAGMIGDQCDWSGSGLTENAERGVTPVYLRCREGSVSWVYPRGALRLLLRPPLGAEQREFRVCVRVLRRPDPPDLFRGDTLNHTHVGSRFPARLFVEGIDRLMPLYAADDGDAREERCFRSRRGRAALYVEAEAEAGAARRVAALRYEVRALATHYDPAAADCRPCSESELELAFCTSDLVSRGIIVDTQHREDLDSTQLTVRLTKLIRATAVAAPDPYDPNSGRKAEDFTDYEETNELEEKSFGGRRKVRELSAHAHVQVSAACGAAGGGGEFVVMARRRLGRLRVVCAPRAERWADVVRERAGNPTAHCMLQS